MLCLQYIVSYLSQIRLEEEQIKSCLQSITFNGGLKWLNFRSTHPIS